MTDEDGWPLGRTMVSVVDPSGKVVAQMQTRYLGRYEIVLEQPCANCKVRAERDGFTGQERAADYNGANSLWFGFALKRQPVSDADLNK